MQPLVLAIEPDLRQAAIVKRIVREKVLADVAVVDSRDAALEAMRTTIPDVLLVSALLSPRDEDELFAHLRTLQHAEHLQTHTIPQLASSIEHGADEDKPKGLLSAFRRRKGSGRAPAGCDPDLFAEEIRAYLERALEKKREVRENAAHEPIAAPSPIVAAAATPRQEPAPNDAQPVSSWESPFEWRPTRTDETPRREEAKREARTASAEPIAAPEPVVAVPNPVVVAPEPIVAAPEPVVVAAEPLVAKPEPVAVAPAPIAAAPEPVVVATEPLVARPKPVVVAPEPLVVAPKPVLTAPKPVASSAAPGLSGHDSIVVTGPALDAVGPVSPSTDESVVVPAPQSVLIPGPRAVLVPRSASGVRRAPEPAVAAPAPRRRLPLEKRHAREWWFENREPARAADTESEMRAVIASLSVPFHVAVMGYAEGCRIRRVRLTAD